MKGTRVMSSEVSTLVLDCIIVFKDGVIIPCPKKVADDLFVRSGKSNLFQINGQTHSFYKVDFIGSKDEYFALYPEKQEQKPQDFSKPVLGDEEVFVLNDVSERLSVFKVFGNIHRETLRSMYRLWKEAENKHAFLVQQGAVTKQGAVVQDFKTASGDMIVFKYFVYSLIETAISKHEGRDRFLEDFRWGGLLEKAKLPTHIEAFAKGLSMTRATKVAKNQSVKGVDELLEKARARYAQIKQLANVV